MATFLTAYQTRVEELAYTSKTQAEIHEAAKMWAEDVIRKSQNPSGRGELGLLQTESHATIRSLIAFTSQPFANMKMFINDTLLPVLNEWQKSGVMGAGKKLFLSGSIYRKLVFGAMLPGIALGAIGRRRPQRDVKELLQDAILMGIGNLIPVVGNALWFGAVMGFEGKSSFAGLHGQLIESLTKTVSSIIKMDADFSDIKSAKRALELVSGIPDWPLRFAENLYSDIYIEGGKLNGKSLLDALRGRPIEAKD